MFDDMFENIGGKIKKFVKFLAVVDMVLFIVLAIIILIYGFVSGHGFLGVLLGGIVGGIGFLSSWISSWKLYGYGEIVQRLISIDKKLGENDYKRHHAFDPNRFKPMPEKDQETLYRFAIEQINKGQYEFACNTLKRISDYKDSKRLLEETESKLKNSNQNR